MISYNDKKDILFGIKARLYSSLLSEDYTATDVQNYREFFELFNNESTSLIFTNKYFSMETFLEQNLISEIVKTDNSIDHNYLMSGYNDIMKEQERLSKTRENLIKKRDRLGNLGIEKLSHAQREEISIWIDTPILLRFWNLLSSKRTRKSLLESKKRLGRNATKLFKTWEEEKEFYTAQELLDKEINHLHAKYLELNRESRKEKNLASYIKKEYESNSNIRSIISKAVEIDNILPLEYRKAILGFVNIYIDGMQNFDSNTWNDMEQNVLAKVSVPENIKLHWMELNKFLESNKSLIKSR